MDPSRVPEPTQRDESVHDGQSAEPGTSHTGRKKRCYSGCTICRARKVKCDERPGGCSNCERLQLKCPGNAQENLPSVKALQLPPQIGVKRKKTYRSCKECRLSKTGCSGDRPRCSRCRRKQIDCTYDAGPDPAWARNLERHSDGKYFDSQALPPSESRSPHQTPQPPQPPQQQQQQHQPKTQTEDSGLHQPPELISGNLDNQCGQTDSHAASEALDWLYDSMLPDKDKLRLLINSYFDHIHPLRCFNFIHRLQFMADFEKDPAPDYSNNALVNTICALGAKFYALLVDTSSRGLSPQEILSAGDKWARYASRLVLADLDTISVDNLMVIILLHDHELRVGRFASAFMLSGMASRMAQALQVNLEYSTDVLCTQSMDGPPPVLREARRRVMWSCYVMDAWVGSGVDQLTLLNDADVKVQLPCRDDIFEAKAAAITETLEPGQILRFLPAGQADSNPVENMGMAAYFARLTGYRKKVLRYVKHLDTACPPWLYESEFSRLDRSLRQWYDSLPPPIQFTAQTQKACKASSQLGGLVHLHCSYHQTMCDLYRIGLPRLFKIQKKIHFPPEKLGFLSSTRQRCFHHAKQIAIILSAAARQGIETLADTWLAVIAHDTNRVMLYYLTNIDRPDALDEHSAINDTIPLVLSNLAILKVMIPLFSMSNSLYEASQKMLDQSGLGHPEPGIPSDHDAKAAAEGLTAPNTPILSTPEHVLNPLAIYRLARKAVADKEKHHPELHQSASAAAAAAAAATASSVATRSESSPNSAWSTPTVHYPSAAGHDQSPPVAFAPGTAAGAGMTPFCPPIQTAFVDNFHHHHHHQQPLLLQHARPKPPVDDLDMFFSADFDTIWQPAETVIESSMGGGIAPWESVHSLTY